MEQVNHIVVKGDTLASIARTYNTTTVDIAYLNDISIKSNLFIGQNLIIKNKTITPSARNAYANPYMVVVTGIGLQSNSSNTIFITWSFKTPNTSKYHIEWTYCTSDGRWFNGTNSTLDNDVTGIVPKESTYNPPDNAVQVRARIKPESTTYEDKDGNEIAHWTGQWTNHYTYIIADNPPGKPSIPSVKMDGYVMTVYNQNLDINATHIEYEIAQADAWLYNTGVAPITTGHAYYKVTIDPHWNYKARARGKRGDIYGPWSDYTDKMTTVPLTPNGFNTIEALSDSSVQLTWDKIQSAKTYSIEYTEKEIYFGGSNATTVIDNITTTSYIVTGLNKGTKYFFRLKCVNDNGSSGWSESRSIIVGSKPEPPSTWSDRTIAIIGETVVLSWLHNTVDGSEQKMAIIELNVNGKITTHSVGMDSKDRPIDIFNLDTSKYIDGDKILWRVKTKGIYPEYSDWSIQRTVEAYAPPTINLNILNDSGNVTNTILNFPFTVQTITGPPTQKPISYHISVKAKDSYTSKTPFGEVYISAGDEIYSKIINIDTNLNLQLSANDIDLENSINYEITAKVTMNSGLSAESTKPFTVSWTEVFATPNAKLIFNKDKLSVSIHPYCERYEDKYMVVEKINGRYKVKNIELSNGFQNAKSIEGARTDNNLQVYMDEQSRMFCIYENGKVIPVTDVMLSIYRRTHDSKFIEISSGIFGDNETYITDPHPSLDYARYRIVSSDNKTGAISYSDIYSKSFDEESVIIQWDETYTDFLFDGDNYEDKENISQSIIRLPYNVTFSESNSPDVSTVNYIGREHPVSYYGTALGVTSSVSSEFDKTDNDMLHQIRKLSVYMGDAYVRLPSGVGYWANVNVTYDRNYDSLVIPVTFDITRVDGGI